MSSQRIHHCKDDREAGKASEELAGGIERVQSLLPRLDRLRLTRRQAIKGVSAAVAAAMLGPVAKLLSPLPARADEAVKTGKFIFPRLKFSVCDDTPDIWNTGLKGDAVLRKNLRELTNVNASDEPKVVKLADFDDLCQNPFVFMTSEGFFKLPGNEEKNLREFLERGGFIHADDCVYPTCKGKIFPSDMPDGVFRERPKESRLEGDRFFRDYVRMVNRLFPDNPMRRVPLDNEIYHIYYDFPKGSPHMQGVDHGLWGLFEPGTGRLMTIATAGDLHCGWMCEYWAKEKNMEAVKMGLNIIIYYLSH